MDSRLFKLGRVTLGGLFKALAVLVIIGSLTLAARIAWVGYGPQPTPTDLREQVAFLESAIDRGAAEEMQQLFPEGFLFLHALTGMTAAQTGGDTGQIRAHLTAVDSAESTGVFGSGMVPEHGIFQAGWSLALAVDLYATTRAAEDAASVTAHAEPVAAALAASSSGFLEGYPGQYWPCDTVVAAAALARAAALLDRPVWLEIVREWRVRATRHLDPATGLLPHRVDASGELLEGARGSSQSIIQTFSVDLDLALDGAPDLASWQRFTDGVRGR